MQPVYLILSDASCFAKRRLSCVFEANAYMTIVLLQLAYVNVSTKGDLKLSFFQELPKDGLVFMIVLGARL